MTRMIVERTIDAPPDRVFVAIADIEQFAGALPHVIRTEWLTEKRIGVGCG